MKNDFQLQAIALRKKGLSYKEIMHTIPVAKSTLSLWLRYIPLKPEQRNRLYTKQVHSMALGARSQKERRRKEIDALLHEAQKEISTPLSDLAFQCFGVALYWAEGSKQKGLEITNSDPHLIVFMVRWFKKIFNVTPENIIARLNIYPQQNETDIKQFWSEITGIPLVNFRKSFVKPLSSGYKKNNLYYGTIKISARRGTDMRIRLFGWLRAILQEENPMLQSAERRWFSLRNTPRPVNLRPYNLMEK